MMNSIVCVVNDECKIQFMIRHRSFYITHFFYQINFQLIKSFDNLLINLHFYHFIFIYFTESVHKVISLELFREICLSPSQRNTQSSTSTYHPQACIDNSQRRSQSHSYLATSCKFQQGFIVPPLRKLRPWAHNILTPQLHTH